MTEADSDSIDCLIQIGEESAAAGDYEDAIATFTKALDRVAIVFPPDEKTTKIARQLTKEILRCRSLLHPDANSVNVQPEAVPVSRRDSARIMIRTGDQFYMDHNYELALSSYENARLLVIMDRRTTPQKTDLLHKLEAKINDCKSRIKD